MGSVILEYELANAYVESKWLLLYWRNAVCFPEPFALFPSQACSFSCFHLQMKAVQQCGGVAITPIYVDRRRLNI